MLAWKEKRNSTDQRRRLFSINPRSQGDNRRATSLIPLPSGPEHHDICLSDNLRFKRLLLSIEGQQRTCCLRIVSERNQSRAAMMVWRGQVIGCIYGKKQAHQLFGKEAHQEALIELAQPQNIVDVYLLTEDIVVASASLFHGHVVEPDLHQTPTEHYQLAIYNMGKNKETGCIVVKNASDLASCLIYIAAGSIVGVYSYAEGWLEPLFESGLHCLQSTSGAKVTASVLDGVSEAKLEQLCFSLTGLVGNSSNWTCQPLVEADLLA